MGIQFSCTGCGKRYNVGDQFAGKKANCKACGTQMLIPASSVSSAAPVTVPPPVPASFEDAAAGADDDYGPVAVDSPPYVPPSSTAAPATLPRGTRFTGGAPVITRGRSSSGGSRIGFRINRIVIALIAIGCVVIFWGVKEMRLSSASASTPQNISCDQLEKSGPGSNAYVHLTKFAVSPGTYIFEHDKNTPSAPWKQAWIPVLPKDGAYIRSLALLIATGQVTEANFPRPKQIKVIVRSKKVGNADDVHRMGERGELTGMVVNSIESLNAEERRHLESAYPEANIATCWIVEDGRTPTSAAGYMGMLAGGLALVLLGLFLMFKPA